MNYIPVRKENYADSGGNVSTYDDGEDLDDQQFIVHGPSINAGENIPSTQRTAITPAQCTGNTSTDSDDDVPKDGVFSTNSFDDENTDNDDDDVPKEVITALAAEEAHSKSTHSRAESSPRDTQGTAEAQGTADFQGTAEAQGTADFQ
ncbi:hypothetical protein Tco_0391756, partial [Tanacetum coccineum]